MNAPSPSSDTRPLFERVQEIIDQIRPVVQADLGDIELVNVTDEGVVEIRFCGACTTCPSSSITLEHTITSNLTSRLPEVTKVIAVD